MLRAFEKLTVFNCKNHWALTEKPTFISIVSNVVTNYIRYDCIKDPTKPAK